MFRVISFIVIALISTNTLAKPPIEAYGQLPNVRSVSVSPSGRQVVFLGRDGEKNYASVYDIEAKKNVTAISLGDVKTHSISFLSENYAVLSASETTRVFGFRDEFEYSGAFSWNLETGKVRQLLRSGVELFPAQSGLGRIVGKLEGEDAVFVPAYVGSAYVDPSYHLLKVNLKTGKARVYRKGSQHTIDWLVNAQGELLAREDFNDSSNKYSIWSYRDGQTKKIYEEKADLPPMNLLGASADGKSIILSTRYKGDERNSIIALSHDGEFSKPLFAREDADVERVLMDVNRVFFGVEYSGLVPSYDFLDGDKVGAIERMQQNFPASAIKLLDWTHGFDKTLTYVAGGNSSPAYYLSDKKETPILKVAQRYNSIKSEDVGEVITIEVKARDGVPIPSVLTLPPKAKMKGNHPTIIMPHGGPEAYDAVGFDWMAQYFANRGYAVLQPNFRGSDGFGAAYEKAGHGEWGRGVMQNDVTDVTKSLIKAGITDPERVCIIGASYGGYSALAGGAFTPDLFKCVAAIAPVTHLPRMLIDEKRQHGNDSWVLSYWKKRIGDLKKERQRLKEMSPADYADEFQAPVLLIHGNDDTVVPYRQSMIMERALTKAGKEVELVKVKGGDHWLSTSETRMETLRALDDFVVKHIGAE